MRFAECACLLVRGVVWYRSAASSVQNGLNSSFSSVRLPDQVGCQSVQFSSGKRGQVPRSVQFTNSSGPDGELIKWAQIDLIRRSNCFKCVHSARDEL